MGHIALTVMKIEGTRVPVTLGDDATVRQLLKAAAKAIGVPVGEVRASYAAKELRIDNHAPFKFNPDCTVVHVIKRMRGGGGGAALELARQMRRLMRDPLPGISVGGPSDDDDPLTWCVKLDGPEGSPYAGGWFQVKLTFPPDFPKTFPAGSFQTRIWHPNVSKEGNICIHQDRDDSSKFAVECVLVALRMLLATPNPDSPLNRDCARQCEEDPEGYREKAALMTRLFAM